MTVLKQAPDAARPDLRMLATGIDPAVIEEARRGVCSTRGRVWARFAERLPEGGMPFLGHSERMEPQTEPLFAPASLTQYRRSGLALSDLGRPGPRPATNAKHARCRFGHT